MSRARRGPLHPLLRESGLKLFLLSLVTGLFTAISIALLWSGDLSPAARREFWAIALFFGAGFIFFTLPALPGLAGKFKPTIEVRDERPAAQDGGGDGLSSELVLRPSGAVSFLVWLVALGFLPISLLMTENPSAIMRGIAWMGVALWGAGAVLMPLAIVQRVHQLRLTEDGFTLNRLSGRYFYRWTEVSGFGVVRPFGVVGFDFAADYPRHRRLRRLGKALFGFEATLVASPYGLSPTDLALLLTRCRGAALSGRWQRPRLQLEGASDPARENLEWRR
ncbi:MAG TPA: hypothetical protein VKB74_03870 [Burkholderiales bacterium]|nr:hypothetical protein [Burkholderiales bacterium]